MTKIRTQIRGSYICITKKMRCTASYSVGTDDRTCSERKERNSDCCAVCANIVYAKQTVLSHHRALHGSLRVLFVCYVRCARFPQMLRACVSLCLRSSWRVKGSPRNAWLQLRCIKSLNMHIKKQQQSLLFSWCVLRDSNPGPTD